jgi:hypothetical protein
VTGFAEQIGKGPGAAFVEANGHDARQWSGGHVCLHGHLWFGPAKPLTE